MRGTKAKKLRHEKAKRVPSSQRTKPCKKCGKYVTVQADDNQPFCQGCRKSLMKKVLAALEEGGADGQSGGDH